MSDLLHRRVRRFVDESLLGATSEPFDALARDIALFQLGAVEPVARLWRALGARPVVGHADIPALPCDAFRARRVAAHPAELDERCFETSGTTASLRGRHAMRTTATYRHAALAWAERWLFPDTRRLGTIVLAPDEAEAPTSSLGFMIARFAETLEGPASWHWQGGRLDLDGLRAATRRGPALLCGTSFAFVHLCDATHPGELALATSSRVMQTGGFKGRSREVDAAELRAAIAARFDLPESHVVGEYGMTELSSQLYQGTLASAALGTPLASPTSYHPPPWMRVTAVDPLTLEALPRGEVGLCRVVDLANIDSAVAIQTSDRVRVIDDGSVELLGRAPGAPPRGCSLGMEELLDD